MENLHEAIAKFEIKFNPEITLSIGKETLGRIQFTNTEQLADFIKRLRKFIEITIKEYRDKEEKSAEAKR